MCTRLARIGLISALIGALWAPAASGQSGLTPPSVADVRPVVDAVDGVAEQAAEIGAVPVDVAPVAEAVHATVAEASNTGAAPPPLPDLPPLPIEAPKLDVPPSPVAAPNAGPTERAASVPVAAAAARVERAVAPTTRIAPAPIARRSEPATVAAQPATRRSAAPAAAAAPLWRLPPLAPDDPMPPDPSAPVSVAYASSPQAAPPAVASEPAPAHCLSCLLSRVQAGPAAAAGVGSGLPFSILTLALLFSPVLLSLRHVLSAARLLPVLIPRPERPG